MSSIQELIEMKSKELAQKHAVIIEEEISRVCKIYNVLPEQLILNYHSNLTIEILIKTPIFCITNQFIFDNGEIKK